MKNLFDITNYPDSEPEELIVGARWAWTRSDVSNTYSSDIYSLKYEFISMSSEGEVLTRTANKEDGRHVFEMPSADTSGIEHGDYTLRTIIIRDADEEEIVIDEHFIVIKPKDNQVRSHVYKVLTAVRALIEGKASVDQESLTVNGRSLTRFSPEEWQKIERDYAQRWANEMRKLAMKNGRKASNKTYIKMSA